MSPDSLKLKIVRSGIDMVASLRYSINNWTGMIGGRELDW